MSLVRQRDEELRCELTDEEVRQRGQDIALKIVQIAGLKERKRLMAREFKDEIDALHNEVDKIGREIREKSTYRSVLVEERRNLPARLLETIRLDTGELVRSRALTPEECQGELFSMEEAARHAEELARGVRREMSAPTGEAAVRQVRERARRAAGADDDDRQHAAEDT